MIAGRWFLASLPVAAASLLFNGHLWTGTGLLVLALLRLLTGRLWLVLGVSSVLTLGFMGWTWQQQIRLVHQRVSLTQPRTLNARLRVQPDQIIWRGANYRFVASQADGQRLLVRGTAKTASEWHRLTGIKSATNWNVTGEQLGMLLAPNFAQFDTAAYWQRRGVVNTLRIASIQRLRLAPSNWLTSWSDWGHRIRAQAIRYCEHLPGALQVYALGLFPGSRSSATTAELLGMQRLGLIHLFAISGLHVALLLTAVEWLAVHARLPREWWEWGLICALPGYGLFAGGGSGVWRACWMRGIQLFGRRTGHPVAPLDAWAVALLVGVFQNPGLLFELGSQLSYGLSLGLILFQPETRRWRQWGLTLISLPALLTSVFQWHILTLLANMLVVPLFPIGLLPVTVIGTLSGDGWPALTQACAAFLSLVDQGLARIANLPGNVVFGQPPWWVAWGWSWAVWWLWRLPPRRRWHGLGWLAVSYGLVFGAIHLPLSGEVSYFDVGQGDSILIRAPFNRHVTLIDVGGRLALPTPAWAPKVPPTYGASQTSVNYLKSRGITTIDEVYLTHHDADHIGDLPAILTNFRVRQLLVPAGMEREPGWQHVRATHPEVPVRPLKVGESASLQVWHPFTPNPADNAGSLALFGRFGAQRFLFMGDLDQAGERQIMAANPNLHAEVLKLGHHGSATASAPAFVAQVRPRVAVVSAGRRNRYHHPSEQTRQTLANQQIPLVSTQTHGMIRYVYRGNGGYWETKLHLQEAAQP